jgi:hypothetical protein
MEEFVYALKTAAIPIYDELTVEEEKQLMELNHEKF